jgi:hypothetical protein
MGLSCATNGTAGILVGEIYQQPPQMDLLTEVMRCVVPFQGITLRTGYRNRQRPGKKKSIGLN